MPVRADCFDQLIADAVKRVQRRKRVLKDVGHVFAPHRAQPAIGCADQIFVFVVGGASGNDAGGNAAGRAYVFFGGSSILR